MKELKTLEFELKETEKQLEDLLLRIKQLRKEVNLIVPNQKVLYEQYITTTDFPTKYNIKSRVNEDTLVLNVLSNKMMEEFDIERHYIYEISDTIIITPLTRKVIETYIPNKKIVLVVEL